MATSSRPKAWVKGGLFGRDDVPWIKADRKQKMFFRSGLYSTIFSFGPKMKNGQDMAKMANYIISAIISDKMVGGKVDILKFRLESIGYDQCGCLDGV